MKTLGHTYTLDAWWGRNWGSFCSPSSQSVAGSPERKGATCLLSTIQRPVLEWGRKWCSLAVLSECGLVPKPWRETSCEEGPEDKLSRSQGSSWGCLVFAQEESQPTSKESSASSPEWLIAKFFSHGCKLVTSFEVPEGPGHHCQLQS